MPPGARKGCIGSGSPSNATVTASFAQRMNRTAVGGGLFAATFARTHSMSRPHNVWLGDGSPTYIVGRRRMGPKPSMMSMSREVYAIPGVYSLARPQSRPALGAGYTNHRDAL